MNELTCNSICQLFCCPPLPSKIASKLAFMPPPVTYELIPCNEDNDTFLFSYIDPVVDSPLQFMPEDIEVTTSVTRRGNKIIVLFMRCVPTTNFTFLLSHGNAVDLGLMLNFMYELGTKLKVNIMCYDYSGYGASSGKPMEKNLYSDVECALDVLRTKYGIPLHKIVLYGQSIGTVPTVYLATLYRTAAVVLHSPLMSGLRVAFPRLRRNYCCDVFPNLSRAPRILSPTLIIHGTRDQVIHVSHGKRICSAITEHLLLDPLFVEGAGHNDCEMFPQYLLRLLKLTNVELPALAQSCYQNASHVRDHVACNHSSSVDSDTKLSAGSSLSSSHSIPACFLEQLDGNAGRVQCSSNKKISPFLVEQLRSFLTKGMGFLRKSGSYLSQSAHAVIDQPSEKSDVHILPSVSYSNRTKLSHSTVTDHSHLECTNVQVEFYPVLLSRSPLPNSIEQSFLPNGHLSTSSSHLSLIDSSPRSLILIQEHEVSG